MDDRERELFEGPGAEGASDPELRRLEGLLARYRHRPEPLRWPDDDGVAPAGAHGPVGRRRALALAAALLVAAGLGWALVVGDDGGEWVETARGERRRIEVGDIGFVELGGGSRFRTDPKGAAPYSYFLEQGSLHASILAPPRTFQIGTPMGLTVDLGCEYEIELGEETSRIEVTLGLVLFEARGRRVWVPAGYACLSRADHGPCAPVPATDGAALLDLRSLESAVGPTAEEIRAAVEAADAVTLWNLLGARNEELRRAACTALAREVPLPAGLGASEVLASEAARLRWREAIPEFRFEPVLEDLWEPRD